MRRYWIGVVSLNHINMGVSEGFVQLCHGKETPLRKMKANDVIFIYSPTKELGIKDRYQCFTAIGRMKDNRIYSYEMSPNFIPFRRDVEFLQEINAVSIHELKDDLEFITDKTRYGAKFRFGHFEISQEDAMKILKKMKC